MVLFIYCVCVAANSVKIRLLILMRAFNKYLFCIWPKSDSKAKSHNHLSREILLLLAILQMSKFALHGLARMSQVSDRISQLNSRPQALNRLLY